MVPDTDKPSCELWAGGDQSLTVFVVGGTRFYSENDGKFSASSAVRRWLTPAWARAGSQFGAD